VPVDPGQARAPLRLDFEVSASARLPAVAAVANTVVSKISLSGTALGSRSRWRRPRDSRPAPASSSPPQTARCALPPPTGTAGYASGPITATDLIRLVERKPIARFLSGPCSACSFQRKLAPLGGKERPGSIGLLAVHQPKRIAVRKMRRTLSSIVASETLPCLDGRDQGRPIHEPARGHLQIQPALPRPRHRRWHPVGHDDAVESPLLFCNLVVEALILRHVHAVHQLYESIMAPTRPRAPPPQTWAGRSPHGALVMWSYVCDDRTQSCCQENA